MIPAWAEGEESAPPASRIHDVVSLFDRDHEAFERISARLRSFESRHGIPVYLAVYSPLMYESAGAQGRVLFDRWIGSGKDGVVVLFNADTRGTLLTLPMRGVAAEGGLPPTRLPDFEVSAAVAGLSGIDVDSGSATDYLDRYTAGLVQSLDTLLAAQAGGGGGIWKYALIVIAIGSAVAGIGFFVQSLSRDSEAKSRTAHYFPEVEIETRLGASHGGARVNVLSYRSEQPGRDRRP